MIMGAKSLLVFAMLASTFATAGCGGARFYRLGRHAEEKGDATSAYEEYCLAAGRYRSNGIVANGLARTRADAAAQSERAGLAAMDEGRYEDAWRLFMRTLEIQPEHATAAPLIRRLEKEHPEAIASAQREWMMRGAVALAVPKGRVLAMAEPTSAPASPSNSTAKSEPAGDAALAAAPPARTTIPPSNVDGKEAAMDSSVSAVDRTDAASSSRQSDSRPVAPADSGGFIAEHTLSLKDRRYPRMVVAVDGIGVHLKDTDSDGQVDLDLFDGKKRIQKVRELELGRSQSFQGKSGELYRLTLLGVHHKSRTVKIGVKRA